MFPVKTNWDMFSKMLVQATAWRVRKLAWELLCFSRVSMALNEMQLHEMFGVRADTNNCVHQLCWLCCISVLPLHKFHHIFGFWDPHPLQTCFDIKDRTQSLPLKATWINFWTCFVSAQWDTWISTLVLWILCWFFFSLSCDQLM